jgi:biopolymer transport protein ExbB
MAAWINVIEWTARLILLGLVGLSVWSISIIIERHRFFKVFASKDASENLYQWIEEHNFQALGTWVEQHQGLRAGTLRTILKGQKLQGQAAMEKAVASFWARERLLLEKGLPILGTLGSTTPFVGLLGTILGIIVSFGALSAGMIDSQKIMASLAEALILTAVGLAVAIPAVVAYNYFSRQLLGLMREAEALRDALLAHLPERKS